MTRVLIKRPPWLKKRLIQNSVLAGTRTILSEERIHTVCESSICPNQNECFANSRATFLLLGDACTRGCAFCSAKRASAKGFVDEDEPRRILDAIRRLGLRYVVITSVTRDDLEDGGAWHFAKAIGVIKKYSRSIKVEVLIPDFKGDRKSIERVVEASPDVFGHNIETVERLYRRVRAGADYNRSLGLLRYVKEVKPDQLTKSSIMVGLGEETEEVFSAMKDMREAGCDILTIGQYLKSRHDNLPVSKYVPPQEFGRYRETALKLGFRSVISGPFVRSSYLAEEAYNETIRGRAP
ncbi:MAG: lipoyl synthase [Candidatus Omnitrophota bacterium]|nr:lipoyl synthase [Candidatus Omnitrophota bacterium]